MRCTRCGKDNVGELDEDSLCSECIFDHPVVGDEEDIDPGDQDGDHESALESVYGPND